MLLLDQKRVFAMYNRLQKSSSSSVDIYLLSPRFFTKAKAIVIASVRLSVMLSPPKPLDKIQPNLVCELLTRMERATSNFFLAPPPGALGRGQKVKYHLISVTKSISKIFLPNFVCVLTNERYKTYQTEF